MKRNWLSAQSADASSTHCDQICAFRTRQVQSGALLMDRHVSTPLIESCEKRLERAPCSAAPPFRSPDRDPGLDVAGTKLRRRRARNVISPCLGAGRRRRWYHNIVMAITAPRIFFSLDLQELTTIAMDPPSYCADAGAFQKQVEPKPTLWSSRLIATADQIVWTEIVHGYTGRCGFQHQPQYVEGIARCGDRLCAGQALS